MANRRAGATAQFRRFGGSNAGLLGMFLNRAGVTTEAMRRAARRGIETGREALSLQGRMFGSQLDLSRALQEAQLGLEGGIFQDRAKYAWDQFNAMRPSDLEMLLTATLPVASSGLLAYLQRQDMSDFEKRMRDIYARQMTGMYDQSVGLTSNIYNAPTFQSRPFYTSPTFDKSTRFGGM